ncbi:hypothetical protein C8Q80DRAFT_1216104 [Daedaleopsis nitida]|nr:hypothetical protein C8Q80DRAFT_1216104 [Daedaleopsis nitida]
MVDIIRDFATDITPSNHLESACAVCGLLTPVSALKKIDEIDINMNLLLPYEPITQQMRTSSSDPITDIEGPVMLPECDNICDPCTTSLDVGKIPVNSLANGLWIGEVPPELTGLSWTEKMLVARVKHDMCIVKVHMSSMSKMKANVVILPPSKEDMDEVMAFMYLGPNVPTEKEYRRTLLLVGHRKVMAALEWLKLNHVDYVDLDICKDNLLQYSEHEPPVVVNYTNTYGSNQDPEATAVNNIEEEDGTDEGDCPFIVHGLTGSTLEHLGKV